MKNKILIIEEDKRLSKLIAKKIHAETKLEVDVAYSISEAKLFLNRYTYFITIIDINMPDAITGELVDYALKKENRVIVISDTMESGFRKTMLKKNIVDYIVKQEVEKVNFTDCILNTIEQILKNRERTILVVDDSIVFRKQMHEMLENLCFNVITVAHGEEALGILQVKPNISLVITDYNMPVMNGLELTLNIRKKYSKNELSILALSGDSSEETSALFLKHGANDYIKKPFSKEEFSCRVNNAIEALENIQMITHYANRDYLTGLYNRRYFYANIGVYLDEIKQTRETFAIAMLDIDYFKKVNDTYGHEIGDKVIIQIADTLKTSTKAGDIVSRFGGEEFCLVLKDISKRGAFEVLERIRAEIENFSYKIDATKNLNFTVSIGATMFQEEESLEENINRADMMLYNAKNGGRNQLLFED